MKILDHIERAIIKNNPFFIQEYPQKKHILLIPGMSGPAWQLFPIARFLRKELDDTEYSVTIVPLGFSWETNANLNLISTTLVKSILEKNIPNHKQGKAETTDFILIGHSYGGRIAWNTASFIQKHYPHIKLQLITMASPLDFKPSLPLISFITNSFSKAFREWSPLHELDLKKIHFTALYSDADIVVNAACATSKVEKRYLKKLAGVAHFQFLEPEKIGQTLLDIISK